ncbi:MAG: hypothetical protein MUC88_27595 [Planctomycetes bacterium]|nr:hypothetical protein [Planctomycetota bacterium]
MRAPGAEAQRNPTKFRECGRSRESPGDIAVQKKADGPEPNLKSTKQELLDAYNEMRQQLAEKDKTQLRPEQLGKLSQQQEAAYQKIQDVAVKAIEGASKLGSFGSLVHTLKEQQTRKQTTED